MKKGDISLNTIAYAAIALLVLVLIVAFATGAFGGLFKGIKTTSPGELETLKNKCLNTCAQAKSLVQTSGTGTWTNSVYCTERYGYDANGDGSVGTDEYKNCWQDPILAGCSTAVTVGNQLFSCTQAADTATTKSDKCSACVSIPIGAAPAAGATP